MRSLIAWVGLGWLLFSCTPTPIEPEPAPTKEVELPTTPYLVVLGVAQDAGYPQAGCAKACCAEAWPNGRHEGPVSLGLVDPASESKYLFEATPDLPQQLERLNGYLDSGDGHTPDGVFLTHAHIGHYTGLMYFGREVQGAQQIPVYAMPKMTEFLTQNGPWSQLVALENIALRGLQGDSTQRLGESLAVTPFAVPHRDEFSETVGYEIQGPEKSALFIPDIDKWNRWNRDLAAEIKAVDYALVDATFFANGELPGRDMTEIPHPFVEETMNLLAELPASEKSKVIFIHFNHTNPLARGDSAAVALVQENGFRVAETGMVLPL